MDEHSAENLADSDQLDKRSTNASPPNPPGKPQWEDYWAHRVAESAKKKVLGYFGIATLLFSALLTLYGIDGMKRLLEGRFTELIDQKVKEAEVRMEKQLVAFETELASGKAVVNKHKEEFIKLAALPPQYRDVATSLSLEVIDLSDTIGPIRDMGAEGATVGFSVAYAMQSNIKTKLHKTETLSARGIYLSAKKHDEWPGEDYEGTSVLGGLKAAQSAGAYVEAQWPYAQQKPTAGALPSYKVATFERIVGIEGLKTALRNGNVVVAGVNVTADWSEPEPDGRIIIRTPLEVQGGHSVCIVGYDAKSANFKFANMWGTNWGSKGFASIRDTDLEQILEVAYTVSVRAHADR